jgi:hypothetical protein
VCRSELNIWHKLASARDRRYVCRSELKTSLVSQIRTRIFLLDACVRPIMWHAACWRWAVSLTVAVLRRCRRLVLGAATAVSARPLSRAVRPSHLGSPLQLRACSTQSDADDDKHLKLVQCRVFNACQSGSCTLGVRKRCRVTCAVACCGHRMCGA